MFEPLLQTNTQIVTSEDDIRRLFYVSKKTSNAKNGFSFFRLVLLTFIILGVTFIGINAPAFLVKSKFIVQNDILNSQTTPLPAPQIPLPGQNAIASVAIDPNINIQANHIVIERINVNAPIIWDVEDNNDSVLRNLQSGVVQLKNSAKPGEKGNVFIAGHSSNYSFAKGSYKTVFALLPDLVIGDKISIKYNSVVYHYSVTEKKVTSPSDISVKEKGDEASISLMTCVPLGTSLKRLVIIAKPTENKGPVSPQLPIIK